MQAIVACAARQGVVARLALNHVVAVVARDQVAVAPAGDHVVAHTAEKRVDGRAADDGVVPAAALDLAADMRRHDRVVPQRADDPGADLRRGVMRDREHVVRELPRQQRAAVGGIDVDHGVVVEDLDPVALGPEHQLRGAADHSQKRQVQPVLGRVEVADRDPPARIARHEQVGPRPAPQGDRPGAGNQDVVAAPAPDRGGAVAALDQVAARRAGVGAVPGPRGQADGARVHDELRERVLGRRGRHDHDPPVHHRSRDRRHVGKRQLRRIGDGGEMQKPPVGSQRQQAQPVIGAARDDEASPVDRDRLHRGDALEPGSKLVDDMVDRQHPPVRRQAHHRQGRALGRADDEEVSPAHLGMDQIAGLVEAGAALAAQELAGHQGAVIRQPLGRDVVAAQRRRHDHHRAVDPHGDQRVGLRPFDPAGAARCRGQHRRTIGRHAPHADLGVARAGRDQAVDPRPGRDPRDPCDVGRQAPGPARGRDRAGPRAGPRPKTGVGRPDLAVRPQRTRTRAADKAGHHQRLAAAGPVEQRDVGGGHVAQPRAVTDLAGRHEPALFVRFPPREPAPQVGQCEQHQPAVEHAQLHVGQVRREHRLRVPVGANM